MQGEIIILKAIWIIGYFYTIGIIIDEYFSQSKRDITDLKILISLIIICIVFWPFILGFEKG